ncbi:tissue factor pathway inhibitor 2 [Varanus komodoensis]|uniref:Tissue factor pathway inhibitor n=1 Tax=Varanus komodoensis TaxID=61221 RepID=A0A8D2LW80_VARKO|nr:tissue factor pathway inhibitor 2 [Varanus komodoensis]
MDCPACANFLVVASLWMLLQCGCAKAVIVPPWIDHRDICLQPPPEDDCGALVARWFYDRYTQTCQKFTYGGCEGNENNFPTLQACLEKCGKIKRVPERCRLEVSEGICRSMIKRYFFNLTSMRCEKFYYGGCEGNENRFHSKVSCLDHCLPIRSGPSFCYSPKDEGFCSASVPRFYYKATIQTCLQFNYTGCGGNNNNFIDEKSCRTACRKAKTWSFVFKKNSMKPGHHLSNKKRIVKKMHSFK